MKSIRFLSVFLFLSATTICHAQVAWTHDYDVARAIAIERDQLILVDFWAIWCGPCKMMDREMWNTPEGVAMTKNVVPLKVDVDRDRSLAIKYNAKSIPMVILMTASGEVVWQEVGFGHPNQYYGVLEQIPENLNGLNRVLARPEVSDFEIAKAYQAAGITIPGSLGNDFLSLSDRYFNKAEKSDDPEQAALAALNRIMNDAYAGRYKKVFKQLEKGEFHDSKEVNELKAFIEAFCYKCQGDEKKYANARQQIENEAYLEALTEAKEN